MKHPKGSLPIIRQDTHSAYLFCIMRAALACRQQNKQAGLFWGKNASIIGEALEA